MIVNEEPQTRDTIFLFKLLYSVWIQKNNNIIIAILKKETNERIQTSLRLLHDTAKLKVPVKSIKFKILAVFLDISLKFSSNSKKFGNSI